LIIVGEGAIVKVCRGRMGMTYKFGIIDCSVCSECGRDRDSGRKGGGGEEDKEKEGKEKRIKKI
jgi:hypothetical protein